MVRHDAVDPKDDIPPDNVNVHAMRINVHFCFSGRLRRFGGGAPRGVQGWILGSRGAEPPELFEK